MQSAPATLRIPSPSDESILKTFETLASEVSDAKFNVSIPFSSLGTFSKFSEVHAKLDNIDLSSTREISSIVMQIPGSTMYVQFHRAISEFIAGNIQQRPSQWEGEIFLDQRGGSGASAELIAAIWRRMATYAESLRDGAAIGGDTRSPFREVMAAQVARLSELTTKILEDSHEARLAQERDLQNQKNGLLEEQERLRVEFEASYKLKLAEVDSARVELEGRQKALDDRDHMHVRRGLRAHITSQLQERLSHPGVSRNVLVTRGLIVAGSLCGLGAFGVLLWSFSADVAGALGRPKLDDVVLFVTLGRFAVAAAGAGGVLFYLLGWFKQIHNDDLHSERDLERYKYDIDRASWAIETILEAQQKEGGSVPVQWIDGVTRSLFVRTEARNDDNNPMEALGALLNVAARAEIGPGGTKLEIEKQGLRKMGKAAADGAKS